ncbi:MAG: FapA family protein [Sulfurisoma sp.]|nr:FapA family protein [Sulfurisoma sp.]
MSSVGNLADLDTGQVLLPSFVARRGDGLYVDISAMDSPELFLRFVERVFVGGTRFSGLDHDLFVKLLFDTTPTDIAALLARFEAEERPPELRLAGDIVAFPAERQALYRGVKLLGGGQAAEYFFEQVTVDTEIQVPRHGDADENGEQSLLGYDKQTVSERAYLDFDEFIAAAWNKGLRYGIDAAAVRETITRDKAERLIIARQKPPLPGRDASIEEKTDALHRDDSPRIRSDGRIDLRHFRNRFPQVVAGMPLFKKVPRVPGVVGWNVAGSELPPPAVKDFDIGTLAGPGTRVERTEGGQEFVIAAMDGFLNIDTQSGQVSITDKIINKEGVSIRTTGDLALAGDEYEEHGEVQEKRVVEGHHMTFFAPVFGSIVSNGGRIVIKQAIFGGAAKSQGGSIVVEGSASRATLEAKRGLIEAARAEGSLLIAQVVRVGRAVDCEIVADEVVIEQAEGCAIAARSATIGVAAARKHDGTILTLLLPDVEGYDKEIEKAAAARTAAEAALAARHMALAALAEQPDLKTYLALQPKIKAGTLAMTPAQEANWQKLLGRLGPALREHSRLHGEMQGLQATVAESGQRIETLRRERSDSLAAVRCAIGEVKGETLVRSRRVRPDQPPLASLPAKELHLKLREAGAAAERIFGGDSGSVSWPPDQGLM